MSNSFYYSLQVDIFKNWVSLHFSAGNTILRTLYDPDFVLRHQCPPVAAFHTWTGDGWIKSLADTSQFSMKEPNTIGWSESSAATIGGWKQKTTKLIGCSDALGGQALVDHLQQWRVLQSCCHSLFVCQLFVHCTYNNKHHIRKKLHNIQSQHFDNKVKDRI